MSNPSVIDTSTIVFKITQNGKEVILNLGSLSKINREDMSGEMVRQPGIFAWWVVMAEDAAAALRSAEIEAEVALAKLSLRVRQEAAKNLPAGKKPTEDQLKELVRADPEYGTIKNWVEDYRKEAEHMKMGVKALEERSKMLQSYGAYRRAEMNMTGMQTPEEEPKGR